MDKKAIITLIFVLMGVYAVAYITYLYPKLTRVKWVKKAFGLVGERPPMLDGLRFPPWGTLWILGLLLGWFVFILLLALLL